MGRAPNGEELDIPVYVTGMSFGLSFEANRAGPRRNNGGLGHCSGEGGTFGRAALIR
jgi:hypothetical protein